MPFTAWPQLTYSTSCPVPLLLGTPHSTVTHSSLPCGDFAYAVPSASNALPSPVILSNLLSGQLPWDQSPCPLKVTPDSAVPLPVIHSVWLTFTEYLPQAKALC